VLLESSIIFVYLKATSLFNIMKKYISTTILVIFCITVYSQELKYDWANSVGGGEADRGRDIATDLYGNVYVTGEFFSDSITFGNKKLKQEDGFGYIVKYNPTGEVMWVKQINSSSSIFCISLSVDLSNNVYLSGYFLKGLEIGKATLQNYGGFDFFIIKFNDTGDVIWAKSIGGIGYDLSSEVHTDYYGNVYVTGSFENNSTLSLGVTYLTGPAKENVFILKYDSSGVIQWAKSAGINNLNKGNNISTDLSGNIYLSGYFSGDSIIFGDYVLKNYGDLDFFIVKYDSEGNVKWAKSAGGKDQESSRSIIVDNYGFAYVIGSFISDTIFFGKFQLYHELGLGLFIIKYDTNGNEIWAQSFNSRSNIFDSDIALDKNGDIYVSGGFGGSISFDTIALSSSGKTDVFYYKIDTSGHVKWGESFGGENDDYCRRNAIDNKGNLYLVTDYQSDSIVFGDSMCFNKGYLDILITKFLNPNSIKPSNNEVFKITKREINVYPNPSNQKITINSNLAFNDATIFVYNSYGQVVRQITHINTQSFSMERNNLSDGIYFIEIFENDKLRTKTKVIFMD
jgi:hypothetical protein